jgi:hypothetical protein
MLSRIVSVLVHSNPHYEFPLENPFSNISGALNPTVGGQEMVELWQSGWQAALHGAVGERWQDVYQRPGGRPIWSRVRVV